MVKSKFAISLHILSLLHLQKGEWLSSEYIAGSLNANPALVRKELAALKAAGLVEGKEGKNGGSMLAKDADKIYLSDIFEIVKEQHIFGFSPNDPNPSCKVGANINTALEGLYTEIDQTVHNKLKQTTLAMFSEPFF
jgi:Rrf2 family protein